jgi:hypothetical protein
MHLTLSPSVGLPGQPEMHITVDGDVITIDDVEYDLSSIQEGDIATAEDAPFVGPITRIDGVLNLTVVTRLDSTAASDQPDSPWVIAGATGEVVIPAARKAIEVPHETDH